VALKGNFGRLVRWSFLFGEHMTTKDFDVSEFLDVATAFSMSPEEMVDMLERNLFQAETYIRELIDAFGDDLTDAQQIVVNDAIEFLEQ
jgi:hypothetical protein